MIQVSKEFVTVVFILASVVMSGILLPVTWYSVLNSDDSDSVPLGSCVPCTVWVLIWETSTLILLTSLNVLDVK